MLIEYLQIARAFLYSNPMIAGIIGGSVVVLFYCKPKEMFKLVALCLVIAVVFYFLSLFAGTVSTGAKQKDQMIYKSRDVVGE